MVVTALGLLLGGRADTGAVRTGAKAARVEGVVSTESLPAFATAVDELGGEAEDGRVLLARTISAEGRSRAFVGGASVPASQLAEVAEPLVAVHGQSDQHRLLRPAAQREALDRFGGEATGALLARYTDLHTPARRDRDRAHRGGHHGPGAGPRGRPAPVRARGDRGRRPGAGGGRRSWPPRRAGSGSPTPCARPPSRPASPCPPSTAAPTPWAPPPRPAPCSKGSASTTPRPPSSPTGWRRSATCSPTWPPTSRPTPPASRPTRPGWPRVSERRAALTALTRKYGDTIDEVLAWSEQSARRLLELDHTDERLVELRELRTGLRAELAEAAAALSEARTRTAAQLGEAVTAELALLAMPHARVSLAVGQHETEAPTHDETARRTAPGGGAVAALHGLRRRRRRVPAGRQHRRRPPRTPQGRLRR